MEKFLSIKNLELICLVLPFIGLACVILKVAPAVIGAASFAAVVRVFLRPENKTPFGLFVAFSGVVLIFFITFI